MNEFNLQGFQYHLVRVRNEFFRLEVECERLRVGVVKLDINTDLSDAGFMINVSALDFLEYLARLLE